MTVDKSFHLRIITPDRVFYEGEANMVEFNTTEGQIGVLPGHIPLTVIIKREYCTFMNRREKGVPPFMRALWKFFPIK